MQNLSVVEKGIWYLGLCAKQYAGESAYLLFYAMCILYLIVTRDKGQRLAGKIFLPQALMLLLTVFNPLFPMLLRSFFDVNNEYYRFFWIAPVVILIAYTLTQLVCCVKKLRIVAIIFAVLMLIAGGSFLYKGGYIKAPNIYKMPTEIPEIAKMIHEDADGRYEGEYYPRAIFEYDYEMCMRQYDPSIMLTADREAYLLALTGAVTQEDIESEEDYRYRVLTVVAAGNRIKPEEFLLGLEKTGTEYVCISSNNEFMCAFMSQRCNLREVGRSANHILYHYALRENTGFTLPDYSDVWENY